MIASVLVLLAVLGGAAAGALPAFQYQAALTPTLPPWPASAAVSLSEESDYQVYLPVVASPTSPCAPIPGVSYGTLDPVGNPTDRPAEQHGDLNLAIRGYEPTSAYAGLVVYNTPHDPGAPQLNTLFADRRVPTFTGVYQVYGWDGNCNCRTELVTDPEVTLIGMGVTPGEVLHMPDSGYDIGSGYEALVLYATEERITLKYTREDNVIYGYTLHVENICVEPSLLALYATWNEAGRSQLPALRSGQPFARARSTSIVVAIRDTGSFMDPRSRDDWWRSY